MARLRRRFGFSGFIGHDSDGMSGGLALLAGGCARGGEGGNGSLH
jgi:hypothetical protein